MKEKHLHIVAFDVPYPPNYGGVIDVYYKIKSLHELGVKVHLHCFEYGRPIKQELAKVCHTVKAYPRKKGINYFLNSLPYIVATRQNDDLINNLVKDNYPILFDGLHCCFYLNDFRLVSRKRFVRMHNIETDYYSSLARIEKKYLKKLYFISEAKKLSSFQKELQKADTIFSISEKDKETLLQYNNHVVTIPAFHQFKEVNVSSSNDIFALYHGNLAVGENNEAALYLVNQVFNDIPLKLVISGSNPSSELKKAVQKFNNITLVCNNDYQQVNELIKSAAINVLPTFQSTGVKLKLLNALFLGKHCLVNDYMVSGSGLNSLCVIANTPSEWKEYLKKLFNQPFDNTEIEKRNLLLLSLYNNKQNAQKLIETIFG